MLVAIHGWLQGKSFSHLNSGQSIDGDKMEMMGASLEGKLMLSFSVIN
jgi:hypothetical protein